ncbi:MAG: helix-turn-helix domain-containing protein [Methylovulum miyakonense]|uniref:helix-turn-helix domain-containing protein n=1 Tax=Methylovulum miyakonense TaxID=645578 RepID=UPI003BB4FFDC
MQANNGHTWLSTWEAGGIAALLDKPRSGRPCKLTDEAKRHVLASVDVPPPRSLKTVLAQLAEQWGVAETDLSASRPRLETGQEIIEIQT